MSVETELGTPKGSMETHRLISAPDFFGRFIMVSNGLVLAIAILNDGGQPSIVKTIIASATSAAFVATGVQPAPPPFEQLVS